MLIQETVLALERGLEGEEGRSRKAFDRGRKGCTLCRTLQTALYERKAQCTVAGANRKRILGPC